MSLRNWLLLLFLSSLYGISYFFIEIALRELEPFTLAFLRVSIASITLLIFVKIAKLELPKTCRSWFLYLVMGLLNNVFPFCLIMWGQLYITSSMAAILLATVPIFVVLFAPILTSTETITPLKSLGAIVGFGGVYVMIQHTLEGGFSLEGYGQFAILGAAFSYALAAIWGKRLPENPPMVHAVCMLCCSSLVLLPIIFIFENPLPLVVSFSTIGAIFALALPSSVLSFILYFTLLARVGAVNLSLMAFLIPITSLTLGITLLNEQLEKSSIIGLAIIISGLVLIDGRLLRKNN